MSVSSETITINAGDGTAEAYVARPEGDGPHPGVLFIVDAIGLRPQTKAMADRVAEWGYVVLAPHVFYRGGTADDLAPKADLMDDDARAAFFTTIRPLMAALAPDVVRTDLISYLDALRALPGVAAGPVGVTGYCMGGRLALNAAQARPGDVGAIGIFHAGGLVTDAVTSPHRNLTGITASVLAIHADNDPGLPPEAVAAFDTALAEAGIPHDTSVYPGAAHGYTMADTGLYHHDAAEHHFTVLRELFSATLG